MDGAGEAAVAESTHKPGVGGRAAPLDDDLMAYAARGAQIALRMAMIYSAA